VRMGHALLEHRLQTTITMRRDVAAPRAVPSCGCVADGDCHGRDATTAHRTATPPDRLAAAIAKRSRGAYLSPARRNKAISRMRCEASFPTRGDRLRDSRGAG
jgi:hypothetical protein